jgi:hypothetical protein
MGEHAVHRVHEHVLPDQRRDGGHDEEGRDHEDAHDALAPHRLIEQDGEKDAEHHGDHEDAAHDQECRLHAGPERTRPDEADVILEADPVEAAFASRRASAGSA